MPLTVDALRLSTLQLENGFAHTPAPNTKRARSWRNISNGVITLIPKPTQTFGILTLWGVFAGFSCVTTTWPCANAWDTSQ